MIPILLKGLRRPGEEGVAVAHGQAYSASKKTIYTSPSFEFASHPVYSKFFELGETHWAQLVLHVKYYFFVISSEL